MLSSIVFIYFISLYSTPFYILVLEELDYHLLCFAIEIIRISRLGHERGIVPVKFNDNFYMEKSFLASLCNEL